MRRFSYKAALSERTAALREKFSRCSFSNKMREGDTTLRPMQTDTVLLNNKYYMKYHDEVKQIQAKSKLILTIVLRA